MTEYRIGQRIEFRFIAQFLYSSRMECLESCPDADAKFSNWIILSENQTMDRAMVGNWFRGKTTIFGSVLSIWIVLVNVIVCVAILAVKRTGFRKWYRNTSDISRSTSWLAVNFSFVQLVIGVIVVPVTLVTESRGVWSFGLPLCRLWLMVQIILVANTFWSLAALTIDRLLHQSSPEYHRKLTDRKSSMVALVVFVWGLSGLALVPLWTSFARKDFVLEEVCAVSMTKDDAVVFLLSAFLCPGSVIVVGGVAILATEVHTIVRGTTPTFDVEEQMSPESEARSAKTSADAIVAAILFVDICSLITWSPSFVVNTLVPFCDEMCIDPGLWTFFLWLGYANAGLAPVLWTIDSAVRARIGSLFKAICCRRSPAAEAELRVKNVTAGLPIHSDAMLDRSVHAILWDDDEKVRFLDESEQTAAAPQEQTN